MRAAIIIPARYKSTRFPGKPLINLNGKPMVLWVAELCKDALSRDAVFVATDDIRIADVVSTAGFEVLMTSEDALTGTDRLAEVAQRVDADVYLNVQGDEPLLNSEDIVRVLEAKERYPDEVINAYCRLLDTEDPSDTSIPKVVFTEDRRMVYMSRNVLPGSKSHAVAPCDYYKQVCIYAYSRKDLEQFAALGRKSVLEDCEDIEILRFLEWGTTIRMVEVAPGGLAVDTPDHVAAVETELIRRHE